MAQRVQHKSANRLGIILFRIRFERVKRPMMLLFETGRFEVTTASRGRPDLLIAQASEAESE